MTMAFSLDQARLYGNMLLREIKPFCERAAIAGSVRRARPEVKDLEVVAIPKWQVELPDLEAHTPTDALGFGLREARTLPTRTNLLYQWARQSQVTWIKPATHEVIPWRVDPAGKYWRGLLPVGLKLDLFLVTPDNWGIMLLIRTGSAEFTQAVVQHAKSIRKRIVGGYMRQGRTDAAPIIPTREEQDAFSELGLQFIEPTARSNGGAIRLVPMLARQSVEP